MINKSMILSAQASVKTNPYKYAVMPGNNAKLIEKVMTQTVRG